MADSPKRLADYHPTLGLKDVPLAPTLHMVRDQPELAMGKGHSKLVRNAMIVPLIEEIFARLHRVLGLNQWQMIIDSDYSSADAIEKLQSGSEELLNEELEATVTRHRNEQTPLFQALGPVMMARGQCTAVPFIPNRLQDGMRNANTMSWNMMDAVPAVFLREQGRQITAQEYETFCAQNIHTLIDIAHLHISAFTKLVGRTKGADGDPQFDYSTLTLQGGRLAPTQAAINEVFTADALQNKPDPATGCPALLAKSPDGEGTVIHYLHRWHMNLAKEHVFPRVHD